MRPSIVLGVDRADCSRVIGRYADSYWVNGCMPVVYATTASIDIGRVMKGLPLHAVMWSIAGRSGPSFEEHLDHALLRCGVSRVHCFILDGPDPDMALEDVLADIDHAHGRFTIWGISGFSAEQCGRITEICVSSGITHPSVFVGHPSEDIVGWVRRHGMSMWVPGENDAIIVDPMLTERDRIIVDTDRFDEVVETWMTLSFRSLMSKKTL